MKTGQDGEELGCMDSMLQEMHAGDLLQPLEEWDLLEQLAHLMVPIHTSWMCPYSWHLTHLVGMRKSLRTLTRWSSMQICPVRRQLAVSGLEQVILRVMVDWLRALLSGHLHQDAAEIAPSARLFSHSMMHR
jgi:hypothetical protein